MRKLLMIKRRLDGNTFTGMCSGSQSTNLSLLHLSVAVPIVHSVSLFSASSAYLNFFFAITNHNIPRMSSAPSSYSCFHLLECSIHTIAEHFSLLWSLSTLSHLGLPDTLPPLSTVNSKERTGYVNLKPLSSNNSFNRKQ